MFLEAITSANNPEQVREEISELERLATRPDRPRVALPNRSTRP
jgi:hypothetical protein